MSDYPIIYSALMIRAILAGRKTQTRRLAITDNGKPSIWQKVQPGDTLWVRESYQSVNGSFIYMADDLNASEVWKPAIHMPRAACRLLLGVEATRQEPLQAMTPEDAFAEGIFQRGPRDFACAADKDAPYGTDPVAGFSALWWSLHGIGSWSCNQEVVALTFRRL